MFHTAICFPPGMRDQEQDNPAYHANGLPPLFAVFNAILSRDMQMVVKHKLGSFKTDAVFTLVAFVLSGSCQQRCRVKSCC